MASSATLMVMTGASVLPASILTLTPLSRKSWIWAWVVKVISVPVTSVYTMLSMSAALMSLLAVLSLTSTVVSKLLWLFWETVNSKALLPASPSTASGLVATMPTTGLSPSTGSAGSSGLLGLSTSLSTWSSSKMVPVALPFGPIAALLGLLISSTKSSDFS